MNVHPDDNERGSRPLIGISASEVRPAETLRQIKEGEPRGTEIALGTDYVKAIETAGGIPVVIPPLGTRTIERLLSRIDGLCLSGGPDIDPVNYGARRTPDVGPTDLDTDRFEIELARSAVGRGLPVLAICRGMQVLNVAFGGDLIQHLPLISKLSHRQDDPGTVPGHRIRIVPGSRLAELSGENEIGVNTFHHQAVHRLGAGFEVTARAPDGVIEAIENGDHDFVIGVQWHGELAGRDLEARLFGELIEAAERSESLTLQRGPD